MEPSKKRQSKGIKQNAGASYSSYIKNVFSPKVPAAAKDPNAEPEKKGRPFWITCKQDLIIQLKKLLNIPRQ